jgi:hypothetical protein
VAEITQEFLQRVRVDIDKALEVVAKRHKLASLTTGKCRYAPHEGNFRFELQGVVRGGQSRLESGYAMLREIYTKLPDIGATFVDDKRGITHTILGASPNGRKVMTQAANGKYTWTPNVVIELHKTTR